MDTSINATDVEISNPQTWSLALRINEDCLQFAAFSDAGTSSLINRKVQLAGS